MSKTTVFFRDDDVGGLTEPLRAVVELLLEERVPCNYLVVPEHLDRGCAEYLRARVCEAPELVRLNQHGLRHAHTIDGRHTYAEFSGGRTLEDQRASLAEGRDALTEMLAEDFDPTVFTPPCHKYDSNTLRALQDLGFRVLSAGIQGSLPARAYYGFGRALGKVDWLGRRVSYHCQRIPSTGLIEISGAIDVDEDVDRRGNKLVKSAADLHREFGARRRDQPRVLGLMLHHANYDSRTKLETLRALVGKLRADPTVEFASINTIADRIMAPAGSMAT